jgi:hypothetical protein
MATLPPDPYAPDPIRAPDGTPLPDDRPESLPGPYNPEPPETDRDSAGDAPSDSQAQD